jgi:hypothetical protein
MTRYTHTVPVLTLHSLDTNRRAAVTLAGPFAGLPRDDRADTAPRLPMVRCEFDWQRDPVLRSAAKKAGAA